MPRAIGTSTGVKEIDGVIRAAGDEVLQHLRGVAMGPADPVCAGGPHQLRAKQVRLQRPTRPRRSTCRDHHRVLCVGQPFGDRRQQRKRHRRWIAAGHRDRCGRRPAVPLAGQLRQSVRPGAGVGGAIELLPRLRVLEPEVGTTVDDHRLGVQLEGQGRRCPVWQGHEDHIMASQGLRRRLRYDAVGERHQMGLVLPQLATGTAPAVTAPISTAGWLSSRRSSSPPAYPVAPATATLTDTRISIADTTVYATVVDMP